MSTMRKKRHTEQSIASANSRRRSDAWRTFLDVLLIYQPDDKGGYLHIAMVYTIDTLKDRYPLCIQLIERRKQIESTRLTFVLVHDLMSSGIVNHGALYIVQSRERACQHTMSMKRAYSGSRTGPRTV